MNKTDRTLIQEAKRNPDAFAALYEKYYQKIYNYFWYRVGHDVEVAEDLTQETFVRAYKALPRYRETGKAYGSYLLTIAHNILVNYYRTPKPISIEATGVEVPQEIWSDIEKKDNIRALWRAVQQLTPAEQNILYLKYKEGYSVAEIARIVGKTENAVKLVLSRARKKLSRHPYLHAIAYFSDTTPQRAPGRYTKYVQKDT